MSDRLLQLMAYADGELEGSELLDIEKLLATDESARETVAQMRGLAPIVRALGARDAEAIASFDVADAVIARLEESQAAPNVTSLDVARARRAKVGAGLAVLAVAAAVAFFMRGANHETPMAKGPTPGPVMTPADSVGIEVDAVQSPGVSVSVFQVPDEANLSTSVVVWVDETGDK